MDNNSLRHQSHSGCSSLADNPGTHIQQHAVSLATHLLQLLHAAAIDHDDDRAPQHKAAANDEDVAAVALQLPLAWPGVR